MARRRTQSVVRELTKVGVINAQGRSHMVKLNKADQVAVETPRGEAALARDLCTKYGCKRVLLCFADNYQSERTASGTKVAISAMARYLLDKG